MGLEWGEFLYLANPLVSAAQGSREIEVKSRLKCQSEYHQMEDLVVKSGAKRSFYQSEQFNPSQGNYSDPESLVHRIYIGFGRFLDKSVFCSSSHSPVLVCLTCFYHLGLCSLGAWLPFAWSHFLRLEWTMIILLLEVCNYPRNTSSAPERLVF